MSARHGESGTLTTGLSSRAAACITDAAEQPAGRHEETVGRRPGSEQSVGSRHFEGGLLMQALVYQGPGKKAFVEHAKPTLAKATDAIVKITRTTICGTDLHILKGDVATCTDGRILGHEGVGVGDVAHAAQPRRGAGPRRAGAGPWATRASPVAAHPDRGSPPASFGQEPVRRHGDPELERVDAPIGRRSRRPDRRPARWRKRSAARPPGGRSRQARAEPSAVARACWPAGADADAARG